MEKKNNPLNLKFQINLVLSQCVRSEKTSILNSKKQYERIKNPSPFVQFAGNDALPADHIIRRHKGDSSG